MKLLVISLTSSSDFVFQSLTLTCCMYSQGMELERQFHKLTHFTINYICQSCWKVTVQIDLLQLVQGKSVVSAPAGQRYWPSGKRQRLTKKNPKERENE